MVLTTVMLLASIAIIVFILIRKAKADANKQRNKLEEILATVAAGNQLSWSHKEISQHSAIAWCADKRILFFIDFPDDDGRTHLIDMSHVRDCEVATRYYHTIGKDRQVSAIELVLTLPENNPINIPIYREAKDGALERERLAANAHQWQQLIFPKK